MRRSRAAVFRAFVPALVGAALLAAAPLIALRTARRLLVTVAHFGENAQGARSRVLGESTVTALDEIRRRIPPDGEYLLLDGGSEWQAATYWVRFELAPRRALYVGRWTDPAHSSRALPTGPRWVVVALPEPPTAELIDRDELRRRMEARDGLR